jgi:hypothetical protein
MQQVLTACLTVVGLAFTGANAGFAADMAVPPLIAPVAALMVFSSVAGSFASLRLTH